MEEKILCFNLFQHATTSQVEVVNSLFVEIVEILVLKQSINFLYFLCWPIRQTRNSIIAIVIANSFSVVQAKK